MEPIEDARRIITQFLNGNREDVRHYFRTLNPQKAALISALVVDSLRAQHSAGKIGDHILSFIELLKYDLR